MSTPGNNTQLRFPESGIQPNPSRGVMASTVFTASFFLSNFCISTRLLSTVDALLPTSLAYWITSLNSDLTCQPHIPGTRSYKDLVLSSRNAPLPGLLVPEAHIPSPQLEGSSSARTSCQLELRKTPQLLGRRVGRRRVAEIQLRNFCTCNTTGVANLGCDGCDRLEEIDRASGTLGTGCGTSRGLA